MFAPGMSTRGKQLAAVFAIVFLLCLPKSVECGYPGGACKRPGSFGRQCVTKHLEPFGFYLIELLAKRDVGFAYSISEACR